MLLNEVGCVWVTTNDHESFLPWPVKGFLATCCGYFISIPQPGGAIELL